MVQKDARLDPGAHCAHPVCIATIHLVLSLLLRLPFLLLLQLPLDCLLIVPTFQAFVTIIFLDPGI